MRPISAWTSSALWALRLSVLCLLSLHALFTPVYEGPDEPFHLARARLFATAPLSEALAGRSIDAALLRSMRAWPCGPSMQAAIHCPEYGGEKASFNLLRAGRSTASIEDQALISNYQAHQPPLYYLGAALLLKLFAPAIGTAPEAQILLLRLAAVLLVGYILCFPLRKLGKGRVRLEALLLSAMLLPGAAESLVRVSNDVGVFAWSVLLLAALSSDLRLRLGLMALLAAVGPLIKLTALPVVGFAAVLVWQKSDWRRGLLVGAAGLAVFPLQWLRGWAWGGTLEANSRWSDLGSTSEVLVGLLHSAATFLKTAVWLGGWSFFRPPDWLALAAPVCCLLLLGRTTQLRNRRRDLAAHLAGLALVGAGFLAFALGQRRIFGVWGGVGGWYFWGWAPWLAQLADDTLEIRPQREPSLIAGAVVLSTAIHLLWFATAYRLYG